MADRKNTDFLWYLVTPRGKSTSLIIAFLVVFILNFTDLSLFFGALSSFGTNGVDRQFLDVLNILVKFSIFMVCSGLCLYFVSEIYKEFREGRDG